MNEFFASVKADLTDRRLLPAVAVVCALLVAAIAYAVLGGGGGSSAPSGPLPSPSASLPRGIAVTGVQARKAVAETTDGFSQQKHGTARDPFSSLPGSGPAPASAASNAAASSSSSGAALTPSSSGGESSSSGGGESSSSSSEPSSSGGSGKEQGKAKPKSKTAYDVTIKFGTLPPGTTPETAQLHEYAKLKLQAPLPSAQQPLLVFRGVTAKGKSATFTLVGEAILSGVGSCLPSPQQCQAVDVKPGETEQLNALGPNGESTIYELRVLSITKETPKASSARAHTASHHAGSGGWQVSRAGQEVLRKAGLLALPFLRYSSQTGVLVFAAPKAEKPHAQGARALRG